MKNILIYGAGVAAKQLLNELENIDGLKLLGVYDDDIIALSELPSGEKLTKSDFVSILQRGEVDEVIIAIPSLSVSQFNRIYSEIVEYDVNVRSLPLKPGQINKIVQFKDLTELQLSKFAGRDLNNVNMDAAKNFYDGKTVLVTGAGGSIGSELVRTLLKFDVAEILCLDHSELALFNLRKEIEESNRKVKVCYYLVSLLDRNWLTKNFQNWNVDIVLHAAAYKHVQLVQENPEFAFRNNVQSTINLLNALPSSVDTFTLISSDKAVRPTNFMGASKRICELLLHAFSCERSDVKCSAVRFGNVMGSSGSVLHIFLDQIARNEALTVTHPDVVRYFMTIAEACSLVINASIKSSTPSSIFLLDMGEPVKIIDLAKQLLEFVGLEASDENVRIIGLKNGEKLYEELLVDACAAPSGLDKIFVASNESDLREEILKLLNSCEERFDLEFIKRLIENHVEGHPKF